MEHLQMFISENMYVMDMYLLCIYQKILLTNSKFLEIYLILHIPYNNKYYDAETYVTFHKYIIMI